MTVLQPLAATREIAAPVRIGKHARPVLEDPNGGFALILFGSILAASSAVALVGRLFFGATGSLVGGGLYIVALASACAVFTRHEARTVGASLAMPPACPSTAGSKR